MMSRRPPVLVLISSRTVPMILVYVLEHELHVSDTGTVGVKVTARFSHAVPCNQSIAKASHESSREYVQSVAFPRRHLVKRIHEGRPRQTNLVARLFRLRSGNVLSPHNSLVSGPIPGMSGSDSGENEAIASPSEAPQSPISTLNPWDLSESDNPAHVRMWLRACHFENLMPIFSSYWGYEMLHMTQAQLVGICGQAEGIRLFNAIHIQPRRTMRFAMVSDPTRQFRVIKLYRLRAEALRTLLVQEFGLNQEPNYSMIFEDPAGTHTVITDNALSIVPDWNLLEIWTDPVSGRPTICIKPYAP